jgi:hypothetical protein
MSIFSISSPFGVPARERTQFRGGFISKLINKVRASMFKFAVYIGFLTNN